MFSLRHPRLYSLAQQIEAGRSRLRWLDLHAAQAIITDHGLANSGLDPLLERKLVDVLVGSSACQELGAEGLDLNNAECLRTLGLSRLADKDADAIVVHLQELGIVSTPEEGKALETDSNASFSNLFNSPLVLSDGHLYLRRTWQQKQRLQAWFDQRSMRANAGLEQLLIEAKAGAKNETQARLSEWLRALFTLPNSETLNNNKNDKALEPDWQALAAVQALVQGFCLISGGPGTGKTSTAAKILLLMLMRSFIANEANTKVSIPVIRLLAPTGKAAVRLHSAIAKQCQGLMDLADLNAEQRAFVLAALPETGETIHRALSGIGALTDTTMPEPRSLGVLGAYRDSQSVLQSLVKPDCGSESGESVSDNRMPGSGAVSGKQLAADVVLIDESSMIDMTLMQDLVEHLPDCDVIFMGDHYQLPPVELGEVFASWTELSKKRAYSDAQKQVFTSLLPWPESAYELATPKLRSQTIVGSQNSALKTNASNPTALESPHRLLCELQKTYRFDGPIYDFSQALRQCSVLNLEQLLPVATPEGRVSSEADLFSNPALSWVDLEHSASPEGQACLDAALERCFECYRPYFDLLSQGAPVEALIAEQARFQILSAAYEGPLGVNWLNQQIERRFVNGRSLYAGKVIMVTQNQPELQLFNGDIGFLVTDKGLAKESSPIGGAGEGVRYTVAFPDKAGGRVDVPFSMIRHWQCAYAMTIHKSQGSEYELVSIFVPSQAGDMVSRRLVYTGVTRSQVEAELWIGRERLLTLS